MATFRTDLIIAARSLVQHRVRNGLLGGATAAVTALFIMLLGLSNGVHETMLRSATTLMSGYVNIGGFYKVTAGQAAPVITGYKKVVEDAKKIAPEIEYTVQRGRGWAKLVSDTGSVQAGIGGIDIQSEPRFKNILHITSGNIDDLAQPNTILLFQTQVDKLDSKIGDVLTISAATTRGVNNTIDVRVVAVAENVGLLSSFNVYVPSQTLRTLYQLNDDTTGVIYAYFPNVADASKVGAKLRDGLAKAGYRMLDPDPKPFFQKFEVVNREEWTGQKLDVTTWDEELGFLNWIISLVDIPSFILIFILGVIVVAGIMNTMWIAIRERTREIGTLRAIGMQRGRVMRMFMTEAMLLALVSTTLGSLVALLIGAMVNSVHMKVPTGVRFLLMQEYLTLSIHPATVIFSGGMIILATTLAAFYPSRRASQLEPVTAMGHVG